MVLFDVAQDCVGEHSQTHLRVEQDLEVKICRAQGDPLGRVAGLGVVRAPSAAQRGLVDVEVRSAFVGEGGVRYGVGDTFTVHPDFLVRASDDFQS